MSKTIISIITLLAIVVVVIIIGAAIKNTAQEQAQDGVISAEAVNVTDSIGNSMIGGGILALVIVIAVIVAPLLK